ncbi:MAG: hypothetical protein GY787_06535 [Alteromonadales bacterium]|nr:hypothetical protein [Alteromonadales bacterium]
MANIPLTYKLSFYDPSKPGGTVAVQNNNTNDATSTATQFSMAELLNTIGAGAPVYADNTAAVAGGLAVGDVYQTDGTAAAPQNIAGGLYAVV